MSTNIHRIIRFIKHVKPVRIPTNYPITPQRSYSTETYKEPVVKELVETKATLEKYRFFSGFVASTILFPFIGDGVIPLMCNVAYLSCNKKSAWYGYGTGALFTVGLMLLGFNAEYSSGSIEYVPPSTESEK